MAEREDAAETLSTADIFGFYLRQDGQVIVTIEFNGKTMSLTMSHAAAESVGFSWLNVAAQAKALEAGERAFAPSGFLAGPPPPMPEEPAETPPVWFTPRNKPSDPN